MFKSFWLHSKSFACLKGKISLSTVVKKKLNVFKKFECVQKILSMVKKIEHGQNIFELADGIGISVFFLKLNF